MLLTLPGASVRWAGLVFAAFSLDCWEDLSSSETVHLCELRKKKKMAEVESKRLNLVEKKREVIRWLDWKSPDSLTAS